MLKIESAVRRWACCLTPAAVGWVLLGELVMKRRRFLKIAAVAVTMGRSPWAVAGPGAVKPFRLSRSGCGRATGYAETNKIVTWQGRTHVAWLDSTDEGFRVRVRTLERAIGEWSRVCTVGEAVDNHGGPALAVDSRGVLHVVYYPHHHRFRYRRSARPNDASQWEPEIEFGQRCTYPTLVCGPDDVLYLTCRRSFPKEPWQVELWKKRPDGPWEGPQVLARARYPGYSHFQESLVWGADHKRLHFCCRFHEKTDSRAYGRIQTVGYMWSDDFGASWFRADGSAIPLPATAETIDVLATGGVDAGRVLRCGAMGVDGRGRPRVLYSVTEGTRSETILAVAANGVWRGQSLSAFLPDEFRGWQLAMPGGISFNADGRMFIAATIQRLEEGEESWGHASSEVVQLTSTEGGGFAFQLLSPLDPHTAHWLPNIERPTGHNRVPARPGVIYTAGPPGQANTDILANEVYWVG